MKIDHVKYNKLTYANIIFILLYCSSMGLLDSLTIKKLYWSLKALFSSVQQRLCDQPFGYKLHAVKVLHSKIVI